MLLPLRRIRLRIAGAVLLLAMSGLTGCSLLPAEQELQPPLVQPVQQEYDMEEVVTGNIQTFLKGTATFASGHVEALSFKESGGVLKGIPVELGQTVKAGELLAELETGDLELQLSLQRLNVERAQLLYEQAKASDANETDLRLRQIDYERETISLGHMENKLAKARLYSPIDGTVTYIQALNTGDNINAYQPVVTVSDPSSLQLTYVAGDAGDLLPVETGMPVSLKYKGKDYSGKVLQSPSSAPATGNQETVDRNAVTLIVGMDNKPGDIHVGDVAELTIELQKRENVLILPRAAVRTYMGSYYVQVLDGERRKELDIEVGLMTPTEAEIAKGLQKGQKVILNN
jgi:RND family efflux transporter MFP subunit